MNVPFLDLNAHHARYRSEIDEAIRSVIDSGAFAGGPFVEQFENAFASYCGTRHAVGVGSGTDALWLALEAIGVRQGDEVITVPMTFVATVEAITRTGAKPVFIDIEARTCTMDPAQLESAITQRTKAVIPVHLFGQMADLSAIMQIAGRRGIPVIEDAAQAHGARHHGAKAGSLGQAGCFSFYPGKNLGALGDAGAVVSSDPHLVERVRILREHGQVRKYEHSVIGWNCRMDGIQAAVLQTKLRHLDHNNRLRRLHADRYRSLLGETPGITLPGTIAAGEPVYHLFAIRVEDRTALMRHLAGRGIGCGIHYPVPVHLQPAFAYLGHRRGDFPVAERCAAEFVSLPMFPELSDAQITYVADSVSNAMRSVIAAQATRRSPHHDHNLPAMRD